MKISIFRNNLFQLWSGCVIHIIKYVLYELHSQSWNIHKIFYSFYEIANFVRRNVEE